MIFSSFVEAFYSFNSSIYDNYTLATVLPGHDGPVNALAFNVTGTLLASGGDDEAVRIWDMSRSRQSQRLVDPEGRWGQITCVKFINPESPPGADWLCFGTGRGMLALYRKSRRAAEFVDVLSVRIFSVGDSVESFAFDNHHNRLAVSSHYGRIKIFRYLQGNFTDLWEDELVDVIPRALLFTNNGRSLSIFEMETGVMQIVSRHRYVRNPDDQEIENGHCRITGNLLVDNMRDGFDIYFPNRSTSAHTFRVESTRTYVRACSISEGGKIAVCGSDHGRVYVFKTGESQVKQELVHGSRSDAVQAIETMTVGGLHFIISGISSGSCDIYVWKRPIRGLTHRDGSPVSATLVTLNIVLAILLALLTRDSWSLRARDMYPRFVARLKSEVSAGTSASGGGVPSPSPIQEHGSVSLPHGSQTSAFAMALREGISYQTMDDQMIQQSYNTPSRFPEELTEMATGNNPAQEGHQGLEFPADVKERHDDMKSSGNQFSLYSAADDYEIVREKGEIKSWEGPNAG